MSLYAGLVLIRDKSKRAIDLSDFTYHDDKATIDKLGRKNAWELRAKASAVLGEKEEKIVRHAPTNKIASVLRHLLTLIGLRSLCQMDLHPVDKKNEMAWKIALRETIDEGKHRLLQCYYAKRFTR